MPETLTARWRGDGPTRGYWRLHCPATGCDALLGRVRPQPVDAAAPALCCPVDGQEYRLHAGLAHLRQATGRRRWGAGGGRPVVGHVAIPLPATIVCPQCGRSLRAVIPPFGVAVRRDDRLTILRETDPQARRRVAAHWMGDHDA